VSAPTRSLRVPCPALKEARDAGTNRYKRGSARALIYCVFGARPGNSILSGSTSLPVDPLQSGPRVFVAFIVVVARRRPADYLARHGRPEPLPPAFLPRTARGDGAAIYRLPAVPPLREPRRPARRSRYVEHDRPCPAGAGARAASGFRGFSGSTITASSDTGFCSALGFGGDALRPMLFVGRSAKSRQRTFLRRDLLRVTEENLNLRPTERRLEGIGLIL
jgi:hypothetical protein